MMFSPIVSKKMSPASVAYIRLKRKATVARTNDVNFLFTFEKALVSPRTVRNPSMKEKALSIPRRNSMTKSRRIQCSPPGKVPCDKQKSNKWFRSYNMYKKRVSIEMDSTYQSYWP